MDYAWLAPVLCVAAFALNVVIARQTPAKHSLSALLAIAAVLGAFAVVVVAFSDALAHLGHGAAGEAGAAPTGEGPRHLLFADAPWFTIGKYNFHVTMVVDWVSIMMLGVASFLGALIQIYSLGYMRGDERYWWFFSVMSLFCAAMLGLALAYNFLLMYMCWELVGLCSFLLIGFWYDERDNAEAAKKAFITTRVGDVGFFVGIALLFLQTGTFQMEEIFGQISAGRIDPAVVTAAGILIFLGAMGKSGQFPLHVWLPDAMAGPTPVSALIHSATMVAAGVYLVARAYPLFAASPVTMAVIATIGTITLIFAATIALTQRDIKRVLAYSTVSQLGYMMMALGVGAFTAGLFHLFTHAFFKALLFLGAGSVIHALEGVFGHRDKRANDVFWMGGLWKRMPITFATFLIAALSLAGIFPLAGFWSKDEILVGALDAGAWLPFLLALITAFLTAFYMFRAIYLAFFGGARWRAVAEAAEAAGHRAPHGGHGVHASRAPHESPWVMTLPLVVIVLLAIGAGWVGIPGVYNPFGELIHFGEAHHAEGINWLVAALGLAAGLLGIGLATIMYLRPLISPAAVSAIMPGAYRTLANKYYFDEAYQWLIDRFVLGLSGLAATFDRKVVNDTIADRPAHLTSASGRRIRYVETGRVYHYAFAFIFGILLVGVVMTAKS